MRKNENGKYEKLACREYEDQERRKFERKYICKNKAFERKVKSRKQIEMYT